MSEQTVVAKQAAIEINGNQYMRDRQGRLVAIENVKEADKFRDEIVRELFADAVRMSQQLALWRQAVAEQFTACVEVLAERYGITRGGVKGNIELTSFDGSMTISRDINEMLAFDERLRFAKELIDQCLVDWTKGSAAEVRTLVMDAFQVDKKGRLNTRRILRLKKLEIDDAKWRRAMDAIGEAVTVVDSAEYYRFSVRQDDGSMKQLPLR